MDSSRFPKQTKAAVARGSGPATQAAPAVQHARGGSGWRLSVAPETRASSRSSSPRRRRRGSGTRPPCAGPRGRGGAVLLGRISGATLTAITGVADGGVGGRESTGECWPGARVRGRSRQGRLAAGGALARDREPCPHLRRERHDAVVRRHRVAVASAASRSRGHRCCRGGR